MTSHVGWVRRHGIGSVRVGVSILSRLRRGFVGLRCVEGNNYFDKFYNKVLSLNGFYNKLYYLRLVLYMK